MSGDFSFSLYRRQKEPRHREKTILEVGRPTRLKQSSTSWLTAMLLNGIKKQQQQTRSLEAPGGACGGCT
jgi:hypothetical protein